VAVGLAAILLLCGSSRAVIINTATGVENTTSPANTSAYSDFPYWNNIGLLGVGTGIYLGNGWVLTADHVVSYGIPDILLNGTYYAPLANSTIQIGASSGSPADMAIFQLAPNPGLSSLSSITIASNAPRASNTLLMIGNGDNRQPNLSISGSLTGYLWDTSGRSMRWGTNNYTGNYVVTETFNHTSTQTFYTTFDNNGNVNECQAADGDSGGAVFYKAGGQWELAGMMFAIDSEGGNIQMADYTGVTFCASLSSYLPMLKPIPGDANDDGLVDVADYDIWAANVGATNATWSMGDFNGDGLVDVADYDIWAANVGDTGGVSPAPEPATMALLALGAASLLRRKR
jgi:hypothetical protein